MPWKEEEEEEEEFNSHLRSPVGEKCGKNSNSNSRKRREKALDDLP